MLIHQKLYTELPMDFQLLNFHIVWAKTAKKIIIL